MICVEQRHPSYFNTGYLYKYIQQIASISKEIRTMQYITQVPKTRAIFEYNFTPFIIFFSELNVIRINKTFSTFYFFEEKFR